jgi:hypothetical protein
MLLRRPLKDPIPEAEREALMPAFAFLLHSHDHLQREWRKWDHDSRVQACAILWKLAREVPIGNVIKLEADNVSSNRVS